MLMAGVRKRFLVALWVLLTGASVSAEVEAPDGYSVDTIPMPEDVVAHVGGLAFRGNGALLMCTREGEIWERHDQSWKLVADGLHEPLGLYVEPGTDRLFAVQRPELTELIDRDGDGFIETFRTVSGIWGMTKNYHEYAFGLVRDSEGNFYGTLNLAHSNEGSVRGSIMGAPVQDRGCSWRVTPSGECSIWSYGMRSPAGIGIGPDDELFYTDNQGDWNETSALHFLARGAFHGHPASLRSHLDFEGKDLNEIPVEQYRALRQRPIVFLPHGEIAASPGEPVFDVTNGKFGPFSGQIFIGDQTTSRVVRVALEKVNGHYQGAVFHFVNGLQSGCIRHRFDRQGRLWLGQTGRGWHSAGSEPFGIQRITWDGETAPFSLHSIRLNEDGFRIRFTEPMERGAAAEAENFKVTRWHYEYRPDYGSPQSDVKSFTPVSVAVSGDGRIVDLGLPPDALEAETVFKISVGSLTSSTGKRLLHSAGYYTLNHLRAVR